MIFDLEEIMVLEGLDDSVVKSSFCSYKEHIQTPNTHMKAHNHLLLKF